MLIISIKKIKINSDHDLHLEKTLSIHNRVVLMKHEFSYNINNYGHKVRLETFSRLLFLEKISSVF